MRQLRAWFIRLASLLKSGRGDQEMADELQCHLEMHVEDNIRAGMSLEEARRHALIQLGGLEQTKEICRDRRGIPFLETSLQDVRYGLRVLARAPGFTAVAIVTLALGIAANSTVFTLLNSWMLRPPRIKDPARVVAILMTDPAKGSWSWDQQLVSAPDFVAWREQNHSFEGMAASELSAFALTGNGDPERLTGMRVSADYFDVLGVHATLGRTFAVGEDQAGHAQVVILSHGLWQRRFASDPGVIGKTVRLDGERYTVAGVMSSRFRVGFYGPQLWAPLILPPERLLPVARIERNLSVVARLKQRVNVSTAKAELATLASRAEQTHPGTTHGWSATAMVLQKYIADEFKVGMRIQMSAVVLLLLIACANIASLQLTRATARQTEIAVRMALGASRFRVVRQLLVENLLVALCGGALGLLISSWSVRVLRNALSVGDYVSEMAHEVTIDHNVLVYTIVVSALAAIVFGAIPAFLQTGGNLQSTLKEGGRSISDAGRRRRALNALVTAQIALALALLTGMGLMTWGFLRSAYAEDGIDPRHVLTANIRLSERQYEGPSQQAAFFDQLIARLEAVPGVVSAGGTTTLASYQAAHVVTFSIQGRAVLQRAERPKAEYFSVTPRLLATFRVPLLRGRGLVPHDHEKAPAVAVVNEAFVRRYFPNDDPLGKHVRFDTGGSDRQDWSEVVGVVGNVSARSEDGWEQQPQVYEAYFQRPSSAMTLVVRTASDPADFASRLRQAIWSVDKDQPVTRVQTMEQVIADDRSQGFIVLALLGSFAGLALAMATVAVFGVVAYSVAQRTHEIGIRIALGAGAGDVYRLIAKNGVVLGFIGVGIGLLLATPLAWLPTGMAPNMPPGQRTTIVFAAGVLLLLVALLASYIPARRAVRIDPTVALRCE